ncbi:hypothetical protein HK102_009713 [Quaeritorhiza haematococci]|nr:hypothetical protein HK102_009713 [Quaeritorhiza haematococci]
MGGRMLKGQKTEGGDDADEEDGGGVDNGVLGLLGAEDDSSDEEEAGDREDGETNDNDNDVQMLDADEDVERLGGQGGDDINDDNDDGDDDGDDELFEGPVFEDQDHGANTPRRPLDLGLAIDDKFKPVTLVEGMLVWAIDPNRGGNFIYAVATRYTDDEDDDLLIVRKYRVSVSRYYELCGFVKSKLKRERWLRQDREVQRALKVFSSTSMAKSDTVGFALMVISDVRRRGMKFCDLLKGIWLALAAPSFPTTHLDIGRFLSNGYEKSSDGAPRSVSLGVVYNRDHNAARNLLHIFVFMCRHNGRRPPPFYSGFEQEYNERLHD